MSLYLFEHDLVYHIIFGVFFLIVLLLLGISGIQIWRSLLVIGSRRKLNKVRYITGWCLLIQCATFTAHYVRSVTATAVLWNIWIPCWCLAYILLSYNLSEIRIPSKSTSVVNALREKSRKQRTIWKIVCCLWFGCTLSKWTGSIYGWILHHRHDSDHIQAIGYLLWKLIAFFMLKLCIYVLFSIESTLSTALNLFKPIKVAAAVSTNKTGTKTSKTKEIVADASTKKIGAVEDQVAELRTALKKIRALIFWEFVLSICLMVSVVYESYVIYKIFRGEYVRNIYAETTVMSMVCYFPLWTLIHIVLLVYGWIPSEAAIPPVIQDLVDYVTETAETAVTADVDVDGDEDVNVDAEPSPRPSLQVMADSNWAGSRTQDMSPMTEIAIVVDHGIDQSDPEPAPAVAGPLQPVPQSY